MLADQIPYRNINGRNGHGVDPKPKASRLPIHFQPEALVIERIHACHEGSQIIIDQRFDDCAANINRVTEPCSDQACICFKLDNNQFQSGDFIGGILPRGCGRQATCVGGNAFNFHKNFVRHRLKKRRA